MQGNDGADRHADLSSHDSFVSGPPHATFERLRKEDPIAWCEEATGSGFWSITRYADIVDLNRDFRTFTSSLGIRLEEMAPDEAAARRSLMETDPPQHTRLRRLVGRGFNRRFIEGYEAEVSELAARVVDEALASTEFDFVAAIAKRLPMLILGRLLGVPEEDGEWLVKKGDEMIANSDPDFTDNVIDKVDTDEYRLMPFRSPAGQELSDYAQKQAALRRKQPRDDVLSLLLEPAADGEPISALEFNNFFALLASAGNDTTRYSIASATKALMDNVQAWARLESADDALWEIAVEELIRWASPTMHFRRTATTTFERHGKMINKGDKVVLWFISGNRDDAIFEHPFALDLARRPNPHMAFGRGGPHACLGMWLARLEVKCVVKEFLKRVKRARQTAPERFLRSNFIHGIKYLPIAVELR